MDDLFKRVLIAYPVITFALWCMKTSMISSGANFRGNPSWGLISTLSSLFSWGLVIVGGFYAFVWVISAVDTWIREKMEARDEALKKFTRLETRELKNELIEFRKRVDDLERLRNQDEKDKREKEYQEKKEQELRDRSPEEAVNKTLESFLF